MHAYARCFQLRWPANQAWKDAATISLNLLSRRIDHQRSQWVVWFLAKARFGEGWVILSYRLEVFRPCGLLATGQSGIQRVNAAACTAVEARHVLKELTRRWIPVLTGTFQVGSILPVSLTQLIDVHYACTHTRRHIFHSWFFDEVVSAVSLKDFLGLGYGGLPWSCPAWWNLSE